MTLSVIFWIQFKSVSSADKWSYSERPFGENISMDPHICIHFHFHSAQYNSRSLPLKHRATKKNTQLQATKTTTQLSSDAAATHIPFFYHHSDLCPCHQLCQQLQSFRHAHHYEAYSRYFITSSRSDFQRINCEARCWFEMWNLLLLLRALSSSRLSPLAWLPLSCLSFSPNTPCCCTSKPWTQLLGKCDVDIQHWQHLSTWLWPCRK